MTSGPTAPPVLRSANVLYPPFLQAMQTGLQRARLAGLELRLFETYRSPQRQDWLYAQGRTRSGKVVTKAKGYQSWHQYGVAADVAAWRDGKWFWDFHAPSVAKYFEGLPVRWGGPDDGPHFQWGSLPSLALAEAVTKSHGILRLWLELDAMADTAKGSKGSV